MDLKPKSELVDNQGKISIDHTLQMHIKLQSGTTTKSECGVCVDPKFALQRATNIQETRAASACSLSPSQRHGGKDAKQGNMLTNIWLTFAGQYS